MDIYRHQISSLLLFSVLSLFIASSTSVQLTISPTRMNVLIGGQAEFVCSYTPDYTSSCDDTFVFWGKKGGDTIANMTYVVNPTKYDIIWQSRVNGEGVPRCLYTLIIKDIRNSDGGQYSCALIRPQSGRFFITQSLAKLQLVIPPPAIYPICQTSVIAGQSLTHGMELVCESLIGQPPVSLKWVSGNYELPAELHKLNDNQLLQLKTSMTSVDVNQLTDPVITCVMELPDPIEETRSCSINTSTTVSVREARIEDSASQIATFTCHVTTNIPYEIDWFLNDQLIKPEDPHDRFFVETKAQALHIRDLTTEDDRGTVACHVATMFGNFTGTAILDIMDMDEEVKKPILSERGNMALVFGLISGVLILLILLNILIWYKCKRRFASGHSVKSSSKLTEENTPLSPISNAHSASNHGHTEVVTETEIRPESQYLDMSKPVKKVAAVNNAHYSPMKSVSKATDDDVYVAPTKDNVGAHENEYMVSSKSDDADTYMYSSTDDLNKTKGKNTPKPVIKFKPTKPLEATAPSSEVKPGPENSGKKVFGQQRRTVPSDNDDANDYEVLAKDVKQVPSKPKLNKMTSEVHFHASPTNSATSSPKLTRNFSAPLLSQEPPEYAVPNDTYEITSPACNSNEAPVYDIPNENSGKSPNINKRINNFEKATEKSSPPLPKSAMRPPMVLKKPHRHSDPPSSSDNDPSPKKTSTRISLPQDESSDQYLVPSVSQQNLDQIKPPTPTPKEGKSPLLKKAKKPFKPKNNNTETYQCLDRQSMDIEKPDYQLLLGMRKVDDCQLYENVGTGAAV